MRFFKITIIVFWAIILASGVFTADMAQAQDNKLVISGHIRHSDGTGMKGVVLDGLPGNPETNSDGFYSVIVGSGWSGTATPKIPLHNFNPPNRIYINVTTDQTDQDYTGTLVTHTISGHIRTSDGTAVEGVTFEGPDGPVTTDASGFLSIEVEAGWSGILKPRLTGYTFVPSDCTYTDVTENIDNQNYQAVQIPGVNCDTPTIRSNGSGDWNNSETWIPKRVPKWNDIVEISPNDTIMITSSAEIRIKGLCNSGTLTSTQDADIKITGEDFIYNQGKVWGGDGADGSPGRNVILTGKETFYNDQNGDIQGGRGGDHYGWIARAGDGGSVEIYGDTITNKGIIGPECYSDSPESDGGNGGHSLTPHGPGSTCGGSYSGNGGNTILLADSLLINTGTGRVATGGGGDANYGHCSPHPGRGGNIIFSAPVTIQNGTIMGCGKGGKFSWDPTIAMTGSEARWHSDNIKIYGGESWTLDLRNLSEAAMVAENKITIGVGKNSIIDLRGAAKGALQGRNVEIFADTILLDEGVRLSDIITSPKLQVCPPKILFDFLIKIPKQLIKGATEDIVFFDLFVLNNSPIEDTYTLKVTDSKGYEMNVHTYQTFKLKALSKTELSLNLVLPASVGASESLTLTVTSHGDPDLMRTANIKIISSQASEDILKDSDNDGLSDADEAKYETDPMNPDTDGDGMKDGWEIAYELDPFTDDAWEDPDEDGYANIEEYEAGADPGVSDLIDFESLPEMLPSDGLKIGDQFRSLYGIAFRLDTDKDGFPDDDALPILEKAGSDDLGRGFFNDSLNENDIAAQGYESQLGDFFLTMGGISADLIISYDTPVAAVSAQIWDIDRHGDNTEQWRIEAMGMEYASGKEDVIDSVRTPVGEDLKLDGKPYTWSFEHETADIYAIRISFVGSTSEYLDMAFDNFVPSSLPMMPKFEGGVFTAGENGVVVIDWLYDGGEYQGELGIFSLSGMEYLAPKAFQKEAVRRALSNTRQEGYVVISDRKEGARYRGFLGERYDRNGGRYKGVKRFNMIPGDRFATLLIPNSTLQKFYDNTETDNPEKRPLFSLISKNSDHGMHIGQLADVNGLGNAFVYEDIDLDDLQSDGDYNDFIIRITGVTAEGIPGLNSLVNPDRNARKKRDSKDWFDWRTETVLGKLLIEHIESPSAQPEDRWVSLTLDAKADLAVYDSLERECSKQGCYIPAAVAEFGSNGQQHISLLDLKAGDYRFVIRSTEDENGLLTVREHVGEDEILSEDRGAVTLGAHETLVTDMAVYDDGDGIEIDVGQAEESPAGPYDFDGNSVIDDADIEAVSLLWNVCDGDEGYDPFYDLDDDGCITILDIMPVVNSK
ncbi:DUF4114 domain-containing protein [Desulfonema magnum]|uniref:DUF4114 n=1 Tax=Desulfonema magnum TaxID=45655 RepID=A0A975BT05_9BACT|nr:DUF4114 domain-containing protein [Desulfonema magnum]QTA90843.1 DUF4114 [Desulfonema magnum]